MDPVRGFEYGVVALLVAVTLASGPLVGAVDLTQEADTAGIGEGNVTVSAVSLPSTARFDRGEFGSETYALEVPDARLNVTSVTGQPVVAYTISIAALNYTRTTTHFFSESNVGRQTLSIQRDSLEPDRDLDDRYDGELRVVVRANDTERTLGRTNVTVRGPE